MGVQGASIEKVRRWVRAASTALDRADRELEALRDDPVWGPGFGAAWQLWQARQRVRMTDQVLAKAEDPRTAEPLPKLKRLRRSRAVGDLEQEDG